MKIDCFSLVALIRQHAFVSHGFVMVRRTAVMAPMNRNRVKQSHALLGNLHAITAVVSWIHGAVTMKTIVKMQAMNLLKLVDQPMLPVQHLISNASTVCIDYIYCTS